MLSALLPGNSLKQNLSGFHYCWLITILVAFIVIQIPLTWLADDAFITLRTVENFYSGFGWRWNTYERVQTYTHPLWFINLLIFRAVIKDPVYLLHTVSIFFSSISLLLAVLLIKTPGRALGLFFLLVGSKAFLDYSSSGLENPLLHSLIALYVLVLLRQSTKQNMQIMFLSLIASLAYLTRQDSILLFFPSLFYAVFAQLKHLDIRSLIYFLTGLAPAIIWSLFSLIYYGFPFPNTAYAKLAHGIPAEFLFDQGVQFYRNSFNWDPLTLFVITLSFFGNLLYGSAHSRLLSLGILAYLLYVLSVGGDYMSGRFLSAPYFVACLTLCFFAPSILISSLALTATLSCFLSPRSPIWPEKDLCRIEDHWRIADQRLRYQPWTGILEYLDHNQRLNHPLAEATKKLEEVFPNVLVSKAIGMQGLELGPSKAIVDIYALADPLLARLPIDNIRNWRIGHFRRTIPAGYLNSIAQNKNLIEDASLSQYYDKLIIITQQPLFDWQRIKTILAFNLGRYDFLLNDYLKRSKPAEAIGKRAKPAVPDTARKGRICGVL